MYAADGVFRGSRLSRKRAKNTNQHHGVCNLSSSICAKIWLSGWLCFVFALLLKDI